MKVTPGFCLLFAFLLLTQLSARAADQDHSPADKQSQQVEQARIAAEKRKAEEERRREEIDRLASEAEEERKQKAIRLDREKKLKEQQRQQAELDRFTVRCRLKPVMTDAEIARCK